MSRIPHGVPAVTYCRILPPIGTMGQGDVIGDGNAVVVVEPGVPSARFEVAQVIDRSFSDQDVCELTVGQRAGAGVGMALNPIATFVNDAANAVVFVVGSKSTKKWQYLKRTMLPFVANEILTFIAQRSQSLPSSLYKAQLTLSAFEIQEEVLVDLLRPGNKGLMVNTHLEEGMIIQGLYRETIVDEGTLLKSLSDACDNRGIHVLPVGGNIDTATAIYEFRLYQSEMNTNSGNNNNNGNIGQQECYSRLLIVDIPCVDLLTTSSSSSNNTNNKVNTIDVSLLASQKLTKSLALFLDIVKKLHTPSTAALAPFRAAKLTHYLSEYLGGNAILTAIGLVAQGEPIQSKVTLELLAALNACISYPIGGREYSDTLRGLLSKYRAMLINLQDEMLLSNDSLTKQQYLEKEYELQSSKLQSELSNAILEKNNAIEDRIRLLEMMELLKSKYQMILQEKLSQSEEFASLQEDNILLAKQIMEDNIKYNELLKQLEDEKLSKEMMNSEKESIQTQMQDELQTKEKILQEKDLKLQQLEELNAIQRNEIEKLQAEKLEQKQDMHKQQEKIIELSAELLTLVNQKDVMNKEIEYLKEMKSQYEQDKKRYEEEKSHLEKTIGGHLEKLITRDELIQSLQQQLATAATSTNKLLSNESKENLHLAEKVIDRMKGTVEEKKEKKYLKKLNELEKQIARVTLDNKLVTQEKERIQAILVEYQTKYESQLHAILMTNNTNNSTDNTSMNTSKTAIQSAWLALLQFYDLLEEDHANYYQKSQLLITQLMTAYRGLYDQYTHTVETIEEIHNLVNSSSSTRGSNSNNNGSSNSSSKAVLVEQGLKKILVDVMNEIYSFSYEKVADVEEKHLPQLEDQIQQLNQLEKQHDIKRQTIMENEKLAAIISTYQQHLQSCENKIVTLQHENITLSVQLQQLHQHALIANSPTKQQQQQQKEQLNSSNGSNSNRSANAANVEGNDDHDHSSTLKRRDTHDLYTQLSNEIRELKQQLLANQQINPMLPTAPTPVAPAAVRPSSNGPNNTATITSNNSGKKLNKSSLPSTPNAPPAAVSSDGVMMMMGPENTGQEEEMMMPVLPVLPISKPKAKESNNVEELRNQLSQTETSLAQSHAKQSALEEELLTYQKYMKDVIPQYQKKIKGLQHQVVSHHQQQQQPQPQKTAAVAPAAGGGDGTVSTPDRKRNGSISSSNSAPAATEEQLKLPAIK